MALHVHETGHQTVRRVHEVHAVNVSYSFANAMNDGLPQETPVKVNEHAKIDVTRLGELPLSEKAVGLR